MVKNTIILVCFILLSILFCGGNSTMVGLQHDAFYPCPGSPNCVSSMAEDAAHFVPPIEYHSFGREKARNLLLDILKNEKNCTVLRADKDYIHAVFTTAIFRFKDDVEFYFPREKHIIHVKSASRIGYSDLGKNRKRVAYLRALFSQQAK